MNIGTGLLRWSLAAAVALLALTGCADLPYYWQSVSGHVQLLRAAQPVEQWMADPSTSDRLKDQLALSQRIRRFAVADLFLDTFPFNAGTTANDALWMGLPVLTYSGRSFASRMAGALLTAAKLDELITHNLQDYEEKAVWLANNLDECRRLHEHLADVRENGVLFDTPLFVRNLEARFKQLVGGL